ncbi:hypothetical protein ACHAW6_014980 [Cyclotella cf. meneghiniana]
MPIMLEIETQSLQQLTLALPNLGVAGFCSHWLQFQALKLSTLPYPWSSVMSFHLWNSSRK